jgi:DNA-binding protein HU-beta
MATTRKTVGKQELVSEVSRETGMPNRQIEKVMGAFMNSITNALQRGEDVRFTGFGTFKVAERAARKGRHPRTGEEMQIPASHRPTFTPGSRLVEAARGGKGGMGKTSGRRAA